MEKISGIYKIVNKANGKYYVGSSIDLYGGTNRLGRLKCHKSRLCKGLHINSHLQNSWNKHGESNFDFVVIELVEPNKLLEVEQEYLDIAKVERCKVYNIIFTASNSGINIEYNRRLKMSESGKKKVFSETHKQNISKFRSGKQTDPTVYKWKNNRTGEEFSGSMFEWYSKYEFTYKWAYRLKSGERKTHKGWMCFIDQI